MGDALFCRGCGKEMQKTEPICPNCGTAVAPARYKDKNAAAILAFFLGGFGVHRFYLGQWWGIFYLLFCCTGIPSLVGIVEFIVFLVCDRSGWDARYNGGVPGKANTAVIIALVVGLVCVMAMFVVIGIMAAVALPAYQDYTLKAKVNLAYTDAGEAAKVLEQSLRMGELPANLKEAGFTLPLPSYVESMDLEDEVIVVRFSVPELSSGMLRLTPTASGSGTVLWTCTGPGLKPQYLPATCRGDE